MRLELPQYYTGDEQLRQVYAYLTRTVEKLNYALSFLDLPETTGDAGVDGREETNNKIIAISENSTNVQYPSARAVYQHAVPQTWQINGKQLSDDIALTAEDVNAVPTVRTVNGKALSDDIVLDADDVGAVPTSREINGHTLINDVDLTPNDLGEADYVTDTGTSGSWTWRKWDSGKIELRAVNNSVTPAAGGAWGTGTGFTYYYFDVPLPVTLQNTDYAVFCTRSDGVTFFVIGCYHSANNQFRMAVAMPSDFNMPAEMFADFMVIGQWK